MKYRTYREAFLPLVSCKLHWNMLISSRNHREKETKRTKKQPKPSRQKKKSNKNTLKIVEGFNKL